jgi:hypothetical protein
MAKHLQKTKEISLEWATHCLFESQPGLFLEACFVAEFCDVCVVPRYIKPRSAKRFLSSCGHVVLRARQP